MLNKLKGFSKNTFKAGTLSLLIAGCDGGSGGGNSETPPSNNTNNSEKITFISELGLMKDVTYNIFNTNGDVVLTIAPNGDVKAEVEKSVIDDLVEKNGTLIVETSGGIDTDSNDNGIDDEDDKLVLGNIHTLIPADQSDISTIKLNLFSESVHNILKGEKGNESFSDVKQLDIAKVVAELGMNDVNNDGTVDFSDINSYDMVKNESELEKILKDTILESIHSGVGIEKSFSELIETKKETTNFVRTKKSNNILLFKGLEINSDIEYEIVGLNTTGFIYPNLFSGEIDLTDYQNGEYKILYREVFVNGKKSAISTFEIPKVESPSGNTEVNEENNNTDDNNNPGEEENTTGDNNEEGNTGSETGDNVDTSGIDNENDDNNNNNENTEPGNGSGGNNENNNNNTDNTNEETEIPDLVEVVEVEIEPVQHTLNSINELDVEIQYVGDISNNILGFNQVSEEIITGTGGAKKSLSDAPNYEKIKSLEVEILNIESEINKKTSTYNHAYDEYLEYKSAYEGLVADKNKWKETLKINIENYKIAKQGVYINAYDERENYDFNLISKYKGARYNTISRDEEYSITLSGQTFIYPYTVHEYSQSFNIDYPKNVYFELYTGTKTTIVDVGDSRSKDFIKEHLYKVLKLDAQINMSTHLLNYSDENYPRKNELDRYEGDYKAWQKSADNLEIYISKLRNNLSSKKNEVDKLSELDQNWLENNTTTGEGGSAKRVLNFHGQEIEISINPNGLTENQIQLELDKKEVEAMKNFTSHSKIVYYKGIPITIEKYGYYENGVGNYPVKLWATFSYGRQNLFTTDKFLVNDSGNDIEDAKNEVKAKLDAEISKISTFDKNERFESSDFGYRKIVVRNGEENVVGMLFNFGHNKFDKFIEGVSSSDIDNEKENLSNYLRNFEPIKSIANFVPIEVTNKHYNYLGQALEFEGGQYNIYEIEGNYYAMYRLDSQHEWHYSSGFNSLGELEGELLEKQTSFIKSVNSFFIDGLNQIKNDIIITTFNTVTSPERFKEALTELVKEVDGVAKVDLEKVTPLLREISNYLANQQVEKLQSEIQKAGIDKLEGTFKDGFLYGGEKFAMDKIDDIKSLMEQNIFDTLWGVIRGGKDIIVSTADSIGKAAMAAGWSTSAKLFEVLDNYDIGNQGRVRTLRLFAETHRDEHNEMIQEELEPFFVEYYELVETLKNALEDPEEILRKTGKTLEYREGVIAGYSGALAVEIGTIAYITKKPSVVKAYMARLTFLKQLKLMGILKFSPEMSEKLYNLSQKLSDLGMPDMKKMRKNIDGMLDGSCVNYISRPKALPQMRQAYSRSVSNVVEKKAKICYKSELEDWLTDQASTINHINKAANNLPAFDTKAALESIKGILTASDLSDEKKKELFHVMTHVTIPSSGVINKHTMKTSTPPKIVGGHTVKSIEGALNSGMKNYYVDKDFEIPLNIEELKKLNKKGTPFNLYRKSIKSKIKIPPQSVFPSSFKNEDMFEMLSKIDITKLDIKNCNPIRTDIEDGGCIDYKGINIIVGIYSPETSNVKRLGTILPNL